MLFEFELVVLFVQWNWKLSFFLLMFDAHIVWVPSFSFEICLELKHERMLFNILNCSCFTAIVRNVFVEIERAHEDKKCISRALWKKDVN